MEHPKLISGQRSRAIFVRESKHDPAFDEDISMADDDYDNDNNDHYRLLNNTRTKETLFTTPFKNVQKTPKSII